jgi:hypothetical protein
VEAARVLVLLSRLTGADTDDRLNGLLAAEKLATAGVRADQHTLPASRGGDPPSGDVAIRALGRFEVLIGGQSIPTSVWKSRKARDLLRILVARRGRPVPRSELCELLWPEDDPGRTGHRLSVLLSIVRGALDPARAHGVDRFVVADQTSIALDIGQVRVDVEDFLAHVAHGRRLVERDAIPEGRLPCPGAPVHGRYGFDFPPATAPAPAGPLTRNERRYGLTDRATAAVLGYRGSAARCRGPRRAPRWPTSTASGGPTSSASGPPSSRSTSGRSPMTTPSPLPGPPRPSGPNWRWPAAADPEPRSCR